MRVYYYKFLARAKRSSSVAIARWVGLSVQELHFLARFLNSSRSQLGDTSHGAVVVSKKFLP